MNNSIEIIEKLKSNDILTPYCIERGCISLTEVNQVQCNEHSLCKSTQTEYFEDVGPLYKLALIEIKDIKKELVALRTAYNRVIHVGSKEVKKNSSSNNKKKRNFPTCGVCNGNLDSECKMCKEDMCGNCDAECIFCSK